MLFPQRSAFLEAAEETAGMKCPFCGHAATQIIDTRMSEEGDTIRRRCRYESCDRRFATYERIELFFSAVVKKNDSCVDYNRNKAKDPMRLVLHKCLASAGAIDEAIVRIEKKFFSYGEKEIGSDRVGEPVTRELKRLDKIGYIQSVSAHRSFKDPVEFRDVLDEATATNMRK